ncbi:MAG TPA: FAD-dependent oxidoreductase, partial [Kofleriaceae bacterium]|nr:FAD-dependent oxidoreductase [Kofleriaceae bacterium]
VLLPAIRVPLARLGVWEQFLADGPTPSPEIRSAWGSTELAAREHIYNPYGPAWHVDRARFDALLARAAREAGADVSLGTRVHRCEREPAGWLLAVERAGARETVSARFVIDATGRAARMARTAGARRIDHDGMVALVGRTAHGAASPTVIMIESARDGWWYSAPVPGGGLVVAFMTDAELLGRSADTTEHWRRALDDTIHTRGRLASSQLDGAVRVTSASTSSHDRVAGPGWVGAGDAAFALDPLAGQGVFKALESGWRAADVARTALASDHVPVAALQHDADDRVARFLAMRRTYYESETRWPDAPFWAARRAGSRIGLAQAIHASVADEEQVSAVLDQSIDA